MHRKIKYFLFIYMTQEFHTNELYRMNVNWQMMCILHTASFILLFLIKLWEKKLLLFTFSFLWQLFYLQLQIRLMLRRKCICILLLISFETFISLLTCFSWNNVHTTSTQTHMQWIERKKKSVVERRRVK